jgi:hypothetical protein
LRRGDHLACIRKLAPLASDRCTVCVLRKAAEHLCRRSR